MEVLVAMTTHPMVPKSMMVGEEYSALLMSSKLTVDFSISLLCNETVPEK